MDPGTYPLRKLLVANRGEIAIRIFRAAAELHLGTVAIYSEEDSTSLHRFKADEAYLIGEGRGPIEAYLDIEGIIEIAKRNEVDAIHPGYGFLAENAAFAQRCREEGIVFVGPAERHLEMFGDKVEAKRQAALAGLPVVPGTEGPVSSWEEVQSFARVHGYPLMIKAASGGGGRGMRVVRTKQEAEEAFQRACSEAQASFGNAAVYVEKYLDQPKHIEVQVIADQQGHIVHLFERDCSVQRRYQKIVEIAPSVSLAENLRQQICDAAVKLLEQTRYVNAGTVEFLVTADGQFYFIEVNPRVQVEHTITELITGVDIVQTQIQIAAGHALHGDAIGIPHQEQISSRGWAIQCRVTTEDPANQFVPDSGKILAYRTSGGFGTRLDGGSGYTGAVITPYYDSLLVKVSVWALSYEQAASKMLRNLREFRIRGVKTNIPFLENVVQHPAFLQGDYNTGFIENTPELFAMKQARDRGTKLLHYIAHTIVNGFPGFAKPVKKPAFAEPAVPAVSYKEPYPDGTRQVLARNGTGGVIQWIKKQQRLLLTDTTFRDAHQSLYATRFRSYDLGQISEATAKRASQLFSLEMWGGATFDASMRFLQDDPWDRLRMIRERVPNVLLQMLLRGANAVGYTSYPDNVIREFVHEAAAAGIDVFRIFDSLNWLEGMRLAIEAVLETGKLAEACICYTGDIHNPARSKYDRQYYVKLAKDIAATGAHMLAIKDMAGLLKPYAAYDLIAALKDAVDLPIHLHTHDGSGSGIATYLKAAEAGVDIVDVAVSSMAGGTSQPSMNALVAALAGQKRSTELDLHQLQELSDYWDGVQPYYAPFGSGQRSSSAEVYLHEMPGGQYSNLQQQARAVGLEPRWNEVKRMYARVNHLFGDIVKVTPSSKVVGDMALFMVQNDLTEEAVFERGAVLAFPDSVVQFFQGHIGQPYQGFPAELQRIVLKGRPAIQERPGALLAPVDFAETEGKLAQQLGRECTKQDLLSYIMYPQIFLDFQQHRQTFSDVSCLDTPTFFYGLRLGEEVTVEIERGKVLVIKLMYIGELQKEGTRTVYFELNGQAREVTVIDESAETAPEARVKADPQNPNHVAATMPGTVVKVLISEGDRVAKGEHLLVTEAMKMETTIQAPRNAMIKRVLASAAEAITAGDLLIELEQPAAAEDR